MIIIGLFVIMIMFFCFLPFIIIGGLFPNSSYNIENVILVKETITEVINKKKYDIQTKKYNFLNEQSETKKEITTADTELQFLLGKRLDIKSEIKRLSKNTKENQEKIQILLEELQRIQERIQILDPKIRELRNKYYSNMVVYENVHIDYQNVMQLFIFRNNNDPELKGNEELLEEIINDFIGQTEFLDTEIIDIKKLIKLEGGAVTKNIKEKNKIHKINLYAKGLNYLLNKYKIEDDERERFNIMYQYEMKKEIEDEKKKEKEKLYIKNKINPGNIISLCEELSIASDDENKNSSKELKYFHGRELNKKKEPNTIKKFEYNVVDELYASYEKSEIVECIQIEEEDKEYITVNKDGHFSSGRKMKPEGTDGPGFINYILKQLGKGKVESTTEIFETSKQINEDELRAGDFAFYNNPVRAGGNEYTMGIFSGRFTEKKIPIYYFFNADPKHDYPSSEFEETNKIETGTYKFGLTKFRYFVRYFNVIDNESFYKSYPLYKELKDQPYVGELFKGDGGK